MSMRYSTSLLGPCLAIAAVSLLSPAAAQQWVVPQWVKPQWVKPQWVKPHTWTWRPRTRRSG